jgi:hypothetical protein
MAPASNEQTTTTTGSQSTTSSTGPATTTPSGQSSTMASQTGTISNSLSTTSSGGNGHNAPSLPANFYPTAPSGLVCTAVPFVWCNGAMTFEPISTYVRREIK